MKVSAACGNVVAEQVRLFAVVVVYSNEYFQHVQD